mmetsp:Transcript_16807/g.54978  ORF Transcript_16807/g.54978 Transcript_16807/m.54978 type:complete len:220 (-) Transcript_16807:593-1252(-)
MRGVIGSFSGATSAIIRASRIIAFVAHVSSSKMRALAPNSSASCMLAACEVLPEASGVLKAVQSLAYGRLLMYGEMSTCSTALPSSARILTAPASVTTSSRPSPGMWLYTPTSSALSSVVLPWKPPPTMRLTPCGTPIPLTRPRFGRTNSRRIDAGDANGRGCPSAGIGRSLAPEARGRTDPSATNDTSPEGASCARRASASSTVSTCARADAASSASK